MTVRVLLFVIVLAGTMSACTEKPESKPLIGRYYTGVLFSKPYSIDVVGDSSDYTASMDSVIAEGDVNLEVILEVPVTLSLEVGRTRIPIRNLLQLNQGSVVELDRAAGDPLDVFVNGTLVAHGEVVIVNDKFGIRLTDVVSPAERIRKLK